MKPYNGQMVYWRFKSSEPRPYKFGYVNYTDQYHLVKMGHYNGDCMGGPIVNINEIEWEVYRN